MQKKLGRTEVLLKETELFKPSARVLKNAIVKQCRAVAAKASKDPATFWSQAAEELKWFPDGRCNIVQNALDRHMGTPIESKIAILWENEAGYKGKLSYGELNREVCKMANGLKNLKVKQGDKVVLYMQNTPELVIAMLACAKIGALHTLVQPGCSSLVLRDRIDSYGARVLITSDIGIHDGKVIHMKAVCEEAIQGTTPVQYILVHRRSAEAVPMKLNRDYYWDALINTQPEKCETESVDPKHPLFITYTSGTGGRPKTVVHAHGAYMIGVSRTFQWSFDIRSSDVFWCTAEGAEIAGHSYAVYAPLMAGITTVLFEGVPIFPQPDRVWRMVQKYKISVLYTTPGLLRLLMGFGNQWPAKHKLSSLRMLGSFGESLNPEVWRWFYKSIGKKRCPVIDTWLQAETGMIALSTFPAVPLKAGSVGFPFPGMEAAVLDDHGKELEAGKAGHLAVKTPWSGAHLSAYALTDDLAHVDKDGYFWVHGQVDDALTMGGHVVSATEVESVLLTHPAVAEAGVIGCSGSSRRERIKAFVILKHGERKSEELAETLKAHVHDSLKNFGGIDEFEFVESLPKTRNGKIMRRIIRAYACGTETGDTSTLAEN